jgi:hypothetical protein
MHVWTLDCVHDAFGVFGTARLDKTGVFRSSSPVRPALRQLPRPPGASWVTCCVSTCFASCASGGGSSYLGPRPRGRLRTRGAASLRAPVSGPNNSKAGVRGRARRRCGGRPRSCPHRGAAFSAAISARAACRAAAPQHRGTRHDHGGHQAPPAAPRRAPPPSPPRRAPPRAPHPGAPRPARGRRRHPAR